MKTTIALPMLLTVALIGGRVAGASASDLRMTVEKPHFTCEGRGSLLSHVDYVPGQYKQDPVGAAPLPCCDGQIGCAQFLSTNTIVRPHRTVRG